MSDTKAERIAKLGGRFQASGTQEVEQKISKKRERDRHSFYLDKDLVEEADRAYREVNHQMYPAEISKSQFWEALMRYGLDHLDEVKNLIEIEEKS